MSRVYSVMTGTSAMRPTADVDEPREDEQFLVEAEDAPFIEIGGPAGMVFSPAPATALKPTAEVKAKTESSRAFPRIAAPVPAPVPAPAPIGLDTPSAAVLSVRFHDVMPRGTGR